MGHKILPFIVLGLLTACGGGTREGAEPAEARDTTPPDPTPVVLFLGTSLTAGLGVENEEAYPALIQQKIDSAGLHFRVANAGESGGTSAGGLRRVEWYLTQPLAVLVVELGANDALRGQDLAVTRQNLQGIIDLTRARHPSVAIVIAGMQAPPNLGRRYTTQFRELFPAVARANRAALVPFLLEGVGGVPELNQGDGIHPTAEGHVIMADLVWKVLEPVLRRVARPPAGPPIGSRGGREGIASAPPLGWPQPSLGVRSARSRTASATPMGGPR